MESAPVVLFIGRNPSSVVEAYHSTTQFVSYAAEIAEVSSRKDSTVSCDVVKQSGFPQL